MSDQHFNGLTPEQGELLSLLAEECAEVIQVVMKIQRHGLYSSHPNNPSVTNEELLTKECGDAFAAFTLLTRIGISSLDAVIDREAAKLQTVGQWLHHHVPTEVRPRTETPEDDDIPF